MDEAVTVIAVLGSIAFGLYLAYLGWSEDRSKRNLARINLAGINWENRGYQQRLESLPKYLPYGTGERGADEIDYREHLGWEKKSA